MKPLDCREWLEAERVAGNDWAREALTVLDALADYENGQDDAKETLQELTALVEDLPGKTVSEKVETIAKRLDDLVEIVGAGSLDDLEDVARRYIDEFWGVWDVLTEAGVVDKNAKVSDTDVSSLLRMFLPT